MRIHIVVGGLIVAVASMMYRAEAEACSLAPFGERFETTADPSDVTPPAAPEVSAQIRAGVACGDSSGATLTLKIAPPISAEALGYQIWISPENVSIPSASTFHPYNQGAPTTTEEVAAWTPYNRTFYLYFSDEPWVHVYLRAVDTAGNVSEPSEILSFDSPGNGCSATGRRALGDFLPIVAIGLWIATRRYKMMRHGT